MPSKQNKQVVIIGGGASGMMAACALKSCKAVILEKNNRLGRKLHITGKGRCNITNASDIEEYMDNIPTNPYFMYSALYGFDYNAVMAFFERLGVSVKLERGKRVFPESDKAGDVVNALEQELKRKAVKVMYNEQVKSLTIDNGRISGVVCESGRQYNADSVIIATGGLSYPATGSTGDGYRLAKQAGHRVTKLYASLVPLKLADDWAAELQGLSLRNVGISVYDQSNKKVYSDFGEMLFTHYGVSGPMILSASSHLAKRLGAGETFRLHIDLKPALNEAALDDRVLRDFAKYSNKEFKNSLPDLLPSALVPVIVRLSGISPEKRVNEVTRQERKALVTLLKGLTAVILGVTGYNDAVITSGGVCVDEINPSTMESKLVKGLYFAGEVIDVDGYTGGFNLQIAFSTGFLAGISCT